VAYRIPPVTFEASDISHWLALDVAGRALHDAGLDLTGIDRDRIGVIVGNTLTGEVSRANNLNLRTPYLRRAVQRALGAVLGDQDLEQVVDAVAHQFSGHMPPVAEDALSGNMANTIAGRISGYFDLGGCSYVVDGACSSALLAVVHAVRFLEAGDLDAVIVGGVDVSLDPFEVVGFAKAGALSRSDIRPYDRRADGMITGEGCGMFVLARPEFARENGLRVRAWIRGAAVSADGAGGITEPVKEGQMRVLRRAYGQAGYPMSSVGLIEGHGTGTPLGDRVEVTAIQEFLLEEGGQASIALGGIKANIGHCKAAAGAAGLAKAVLALERRIKPPHVNAALPNPLFAERPGLLYPNVEGEPWIGSSVAPRRAGVSSMGFGGANSHVTLEEARWGGEPDREDLALLGSAQSSEVVFLTARDKAGLGSEAVRLAGIAERISRAELTDLAAECARRAPLGPVRAALVVDSPWQLAANLRELASRLATPGPVEAASLPASRIFAGEPSAVPRIAAMFPGQGSQLVNMGRALKLRRPDVRSLYDSVARTLHDAGLPDVEALMHRPTHKASLEDRAAWDAALRDTAVAQPAIMLASIATLETLRAWGIEPDLAFGHSLGEIGALCCAGALAPEAAVLLAAQRGRAMGELALPDPGAMMAVFADPETVEALLDAWPDAELVIANYNAVDQTIVAGARAAVRRLQQHCEDANIGCRVLPVSHAFHSDMVAPAAHLFQQDLRMTALQPLAERRVFSAALARELGPADSLEELLTAQIRLPVQFLQTLQAVAREHPDMVVEIGPGRVLAGLALRCGEFDAERIFDTHDAVEDPWLSLLTVAAAAFARGAPVRCTELFAHRLVRPFPLDGYDPVFIRNPCENPVAPFPQTLDIAAGAGGLLPPEAAGEAGRDYLKQRGGFLRELIAADFRHHGTAVQADSASVQPRPLQIVVSSAAPAASLDLVLEARKWVAQRTGYPLEDVDAQVNLRKVLNLDSIKTGELVVHLSALLGREANAHPSALANASIASIVAEMQNRAPDETPKFLARTQRWENVFQRVEVAIDAPAAAPTGSLAVIGVGDATFAQRCSEQLRARQVDVRLLAMDEFLAEAERVSDIDTFVFTFDAPPQDLFACPQAAEEVQAFSTDLFRCFRALLRAKGGDGRNLRILCLRPRSAEDPAGDREAAAAFLKSFQLETGAALASWVCVPAEAARMDDIILRELCAADGSGPIRHDDSGRRTVQRLTHWRAGPGAGLPLGPEDVVLVSGGAKGITPELALALARRCRARFVLFGASPPPADADPGHPIARTLARFDAEGIGCAYRQCDVSDAAAVAAMVADIGATIGPVTGFLHGAGVTEFATLADKTLASFRRCIAIKDIGLLNVLRALPPGTLRLMHAISSVLGHSGMRLQTDYTFANAWLDEAIAALKRRHPHIDCLTIGYTVWSGTGLGVKTGALDGLEQLGVDAITIEEGVQAYERLLDARREDETAFVHTGALTQDLAQNMFGPPPPHAFRFLEQILRWAPGTELLAECALTHQSDPFLADHVFEDTPILPGVMGMEAMGEAVRLVLGEDVPFALRDVRFEQPVIVPKDGITRVRVAAVRRADGGGFDLVVSNAADGSTCLRAVAEIHPTALPAVAPLTRASLGQPIDLDPESLHPDPLFQGRLFRNIEALFVREDTRAVSQVRVPAGAKYFSEPGFRLATASPAAQDSFLQTGGVVAPRGYLPTGIARAQWSRLLEAGEAVLCEARLVGADTGSRTLRADIRVFDLQGGLIGQLSGVDLVAAGRGADEDLPSLAAGVTAAGGRAEYRAPEAPVALGFASGGLQARRQAAVRAGLRRLGVEMPAGGLAASSPDAAPRLPGANLALSLSHAGRFSVAAVSAAGPLGVDLEVVSPRSERTWRGLLGEQGLEAAHRMARQFGLQLDLASTMIWSLVEALRKAAALDVTLEHPWHWHARGKWLQAACSDGQARVRLRALRLSRQWFTLALCHGSAAVSPSRAIALPRILRVASGQLAATE
jgi:enediyne polyketide synthase